MTVTTPVSESVVRLFKKTLIPEALKESIFGQMVGTVLNQESELSNMRGKDFTSTLGLNLTGTGFGLSTPVDGNEDSIAQFTDTVTVDQLTEPLLLPTKDNVDQHVIGWEYSAEGFDRLRKWFTVTFEIWAANQLAGNTATQIGSGTDTIPYDGRVYIPGRTIFATGNNTATAPTSQRIVSAGGAANDESLTSTDVMTLGLVEAAVEKARTASPIIEKVSFEGQMVYPLLVSDEQWTDLLRDTSGSVQVVDISLSMLAGGQSPFSNPLMKVRGFMYQDAMIIRNTRVPYGVNSSTGAQISTVRRAMLLGNQAVSFGFKGAGKGEASFHEKFKDGGRLVQITGNIIGGLKKTVYNGEDYAVITIPTFAAAHTS